MKFTNILSTVQNWQCGMQFLLMALLVPISMRMQGGIQ